MQTVHEVWENGVLISSTTIEVPDPEPVPDTVKFDVFADTLEAALEGATTNAKIRAAFLTAIEAGRSAG